jgi:O-antigen/teichoic acid export membrane protein
MSISKGIKDIIVWRGLNFLSVLVLNILLARFLQADDAGHLFFVVNNLSLLILVLSFSLESGLTYYSANGEIDPRTAGRLALLYSGLMSIVAIAFFYTWNRNSHFQLEWPALFFVTGNLLISFFSALLYARNNFFLPNLFLLVVNVLFILLFIPPIAEKVTNDVLVLAYFTTFILQGAALAIAYFAAIKDADASYVTWKNIRPLFRYAAVAFTGNLIFFFVYRADYWFVERWSSAHDLGNYIQVSKIVQWFVIIPSMIGTVIFPLTAMGKDPSLIRKVALLSRVLFALFFMVCITLALTGRFLFPWIFGETFNDMYMIFLLYIPGILALVSLYPVSAWHSGVNRLSINIKGSLLALFVILVGNTIFTPRYGAYAAAITSSVAYILYFVFSLYHFGKVTNIPMSQFFRIMAADLTTLRNEVNKNKKLPTAQGNEID